MFTAYHIVWLVICFVLISAALVLLRKYRLPLQTVLTLACAGCALSETVKVLSSITLVASADGSTFYPYLPLNHLPFHLCSLQILFIYYVRFSGSTSRRNTLLAFMYPSCLIGAFLALLMPSIFSNSIEPSQAFTHPLGYQYFLYHSMLIVLAVQIWQSGEVDFRPRHYWTSMGILGALGLICIYLNSMFSSATYENGELISVDFGTNFFFIFQPPLSITLTALWQWYVYFAILAVLAFLLVALVYIPVFRKAKKLKQQSA